MAKYAKLTEDATQRFEQYRNAVGQIQNCKFLANLNDIQYSIFPDGSTCLTGVEREELVAFLTTLRQFTLKKSPIQFTGICKLLRRQCDDENTTKWALYARDHWLNTMKSTPCLCKNENEGLNVDETLNLFIYSGLVKSETKQFQQLKALSPGVAEFLMLNIPAVADALVHDLRLIDSLIDLYQTDSLDKASSFEVEG